MSPVHGRHGIITTKSIVMRFNMPLKLLPSFQNKPENQLQRGACVVHMSSYSIGSSRLSLSFPPPCWCIFNIPIIAEQPEMSHLGTSLFPLHLCLLFKEANSPSSSSSASLLWWIPPAMLISSASQQLPQRPPSACEEDRLQLCPLSTLPSPLIVTHEGLPFGGPPSYLPCQVFVPSD